MAKRHRSASQEAILPPEESNAANDSLISWKTKSNKDIAAISVIDKYFDSV